jgi:uncharacterized protein YqeY
MLRLFTRRFATLGDQQLRDKLKESLKLSMRQKDKISVNVIKSVLADIVNEEKSGLEKKLGVSQLIQKGIKRRNDAMEQYRQANREDLAQQEDEERKVLESFLPKQLSPDEIREKVMEVKERIGAKSTGDLGKLMKVLNDELDPALAPRKLISEVAKAVLSGK